MNMQNDQMTLTVSLYRVRHRHVTLQTTAPESPPELTKPLRLARILAMAHIVSAQIMSGEIENYEAAAKHYRVSRPRISQIVDLMLLAPDIQEQILFMTNAQGCDPIGEHDLRPLIRQTHGDWAAQRRIWAQLLAARGVLP